MKRFLSILLSVLMVVSVLAILASCNGNEQKTTTSADTTEAVTTTAKTDTTTAKTDTTTAKTDTTTAKTDTTTATVTETTTAKTDTTTVTDKQTTEVTTVTETVTTKPEETTTTAGETTTAKPVETTTLAVFARFDFGTKTYAEDEGLTSHDYLMEILNYDDACIMVSFEDDYWDVWTVADFDASNQITEAFGNGLKNQRFALIFNDIVGLDFDDEIKLGYGSYNGTPYKSVEDIETPVWSGRHQFMQVRLVNDTPNNIWSIRYIKTGDSAYYTTAVMGNLYLQGGEPESETDYRRTCEPTKEWATYTYDMFFTASLASGRGGAITGKERPTEGLDNYFSYKQYVYTNGGLPGGNNVTWSQGKGFVALELNLFAGIYGGTNDNPNISEEALSTALTNIKQSCDTRANIKSGWNVKIDYLIFGCSPEQLDAWHSYLEDA